MRWAKAALVARWAMLFISALSTHEASAVVTPGTVHYQSFPVPGTVATQVWFWENVFSRYPSSATIVHDPDFPAILIDVIDFNSFAKRFNGGRAYTNAQKAAISEKYAKRYELAMRRFHEEGKKAANYGAMEQRIYDVYHKDQAAYAALLAGRTSVRTQAGLADEFREAANRAEKYLPYMERIFRSHKLPVDLTRLAFVESMFNEKAISKVGASGIWQFMPSTARLFMRVSRHVDERNSPLKATEAAAQLLKMNYSKLGAWPLAVTAYNHGAGGMLKAVRRVGSRDLGRIIQRYDSPSFGFASRNFYAEFLAARKVYNSRFAKPEATNPDPLGIARVKLSKPVSVYQLIQYTALDKATLKRFNPCLLPSAFTYNKYRLLPRGYEIIVPKEIHDEVKQNLSRLWAGNRSKRNKL